MTEPSTVDTTQKNSVALIINGIVYDIMSCSDYTRDLYLSNPTFVQVGQGEVEFGYNFDGTTFTYGEFTFPDPE